MKLIKIKYATLAVSLLLVGASVPPLVHALSLRRAGVQTVADATPLTHNVTQTFTLDKDQHAFFRVTLPQGASTVVLDMRRADSRKGSMTVNVDFSRNSALNALRKTKPLNGISVGAVLDTESRVIVGSALKQPIPVVLDIHNQGVPCRYWLTDLETPSTVTASAARSSPAFALPMYGEVAPKPITLGETETGRLEKNGHAYFRVALKAGRYQSLLSFSRVDGKSTNPAPVDGELTLSDENGFRLFDDKGAPAPLASSDHFFKDVNELHASQSPGQDAAKFELKQDGEFLVTLSNQASSTTADDSAPVNFTEQIVPDNSQPTLTKQN